MVHGMEIGTPDMPESATTPAMATMVTMADAKVVPISDSTVDAMCLRLTRTSIRSFGLDFEVPGTNMSDEWFGRQGL
jgi:hypothetical protein